MSTYRQYFAANALYANEHKGVSVPAKDARGEEEMLWMELLAPYLQGKYNVKDQIFVDPFFAEYDPDNAYITGAAVNVKLDLPESGAENVYWNKQSVTDGRGEDFRLTQITEPNKRIFLGDCPNWFMNDKEGKKPETTRHDGGTTGMFVRFDGSIVYLTEAEALLAVTDPAEL